MSLDGLAFDDELLDLLADRLADRLASRLELAIKPREALINAIEVARMVGRKRSWVYEHAGNLCAVHLGPGPRPRLGFYRARERIPEEHREPAADLAAGLRATPPPPATAWIRRFRRETAPHPRPPNLRDVAPDCRASPVLGTHRIFRCALPR
jgi:hypothetical protein